MLACALAGCATHQVKVDSLARPSAQAASYVIRVSPAVAKADSLRAQHLAAQVRAALGSRGLYEAPPNTTPDVVVVIDCGVLPPEMQPKRLPSSLHGTEPIFMPPDRVQVGTDENGQPVYRRREIYRTREGYFEMVPVFEKYLRVVAQESAPRVEGRGPTEIWRVDVTIESESHDLRSALPVLVAAGIDHLGTDSRGQKTVRIKETDAAVQGVKRGH